MSAASVDRENREDDSPFSAENVLLMDANGEDKVEEEFIFRLWLDFIPPDHNPQRNIPSFFSRSFVPVEKGFFRNVVVFSLPFPPDDDIFNVSMFKYEGPVDASPSHEKVDDILIS